MKTKYVHETSVTFVTYLTYQIQFHAGYWQPTISLCDKIDIFRKYTWLLFDSWFRSVCVLDSRFVFEHQVGGTRCRSIRWEDRDADPSGGRNTMQIHQVGGWRCTPSCIWPTTCAVVAFTKTSAADVLHHNHPFLLETEYPACFSPSLGTTNIVVSRSFRRGCEQVHLYIMEVYRRYMHPPFRFLKQLSNLESL